LSIPIRHIDKGAIVNKVEVSIVDHLSNFQGDREQYEANKNFAM